LGVAFAIIGYFLKKILDNVEGLSDKLDELWKDLHDMKPRLDFLWENRKN
jgi:regulator of replication initiation timing